MKQHRLLITLLLVTVAMQSTLADEIKIVGQNVQNFFYSLDRGRTQHNGVALSNYNTVEGRTAKLNAIINTLSQYNADIYAFNEIEVKVNGSAADEDALALLAQAMSAKTGKSYVAVADDQTYELSASADGLIRSGFIYNSATIETVGASVSTAYGYSNIYPAQMRMQTFKSKASGEMFNLTMNHFKASTSDDPSYDINQREGNSIALLKGLDQATADPDILVLGDLNTEMGEQCLNNLVDAGYEEQILKRDPNAVSHWYNYVGYLIDHTFANSTMAAQVTDAHIEYVANKHSVGDNAYSDHDPYVVTLNLQAQEAATYSYKKVSTVTAGKKYLLVANNSKTANPIDIDKNYDRLSATDVTPSDGVITMTTNKNGFKFEDAGSNQFNIKDYYGRYIYQQGTYANIQTGNKDKASNNNWDFELVAYDDAYKIQTSNGYYLLYQKNYSNFSWVNYASIYSGNYVTSLWEYDPTEATGISTVNVYSQPTVTRKSIVNGRLIIVTGNGQKYTAAGIEIR